jgi:hypothetical protein
MLGDIVVDRLLSQPQLLVLQSSLWGHVLRVLATTAPPITSWPLHRTRDPAEAADGQQTTLVRVGEATHRRWTFVITTTERTGVELGILHNP